MLPELALLLPALVLTVLVAREAWQQQRRLRRLQRGLRRLEAWQQDGRWAGAGLEPAADLLARGLDRLQRVLGRVFVGSRGVPEAVPGDAELLQDFLQTRPDPAGFRARFPHIPLILPGENRSATVNGAPQAAYHAQLDAEGRIVGGEFR